MSDESPTSLERVIAAEAAAARELAAVPDWIWDGEMLPVPIEAICDSHYGLLIEEHEDLGTLVGAASGVHLSGVLLPAAREVWVNAGEAPVRRRFTVGHELGHWVMHAGRGESRQDGVVHCREREVREEAAGELGIVHDYLDYPPAELDANQFAAAMLMPASLIASDAVPASDDGGRCRMLGVSPEALRMRQWFLSQRASRGATASERFGIAHPSQPGDRRADLSLGRWRAR